MLWCQQLGVRFGIYDFYEEELKPKGLPQTNLPKHFDPQFLTKIHLDGFGTWDETHRKVQPGSASKNGKVLTNRNFHYVFPRDENGKISLEGQYSKDMSTQMRCKYSEEVRLCIGVAVVTPLGPNGEPMDRIGKRLEPFDYSRTTLLSISDFKKKVNEEILRVRSLKHGQKSGWVIEDSRAEGKSFQNDSIIKLSKCGKKTLEKMKSVGIVVVKDVLKMTSEQKGKALLSKISEITLKCSHCPGKGG